jgi:hypothetical protein
MKDRVILGSLRQGANLVKRAAQARAPQGKTGRLRSGIVVRNSKIHKGRMSTDLIGVYITIKSKKKGDPFYGRFQEDGWNTAGKRKSVVRRAIVAAFGDRTGRKTMPGKTNVPGKKFLDGAWNDNKERAVDLIRHSAISATELLARKLGLLHGRKGRNYIIQRRGGSFHFVR